MLDSRDRDRLAQDLHNTLGNIPGLNKRELQNSLDMRRWSGITTSEINSVLYSFRHLFSISDDSVPPRWYAIGSISVAPTLPQRLSQFYEGDTPRDWQTEAFDAWRRAGHRGIVEAVTGTGKTTVGIMAAADAVARGLLVLIIVPGRDLLDQWYEKLSRELPDLYIGRYGDTWKDTFDNHHIIVSTVQSAYRKSILPYGLSGLLIADEVHRYGAEKFAAALEQNYDERLGLTATYEREDEGIARVLAPYFRPKAYDAGTVSEIVAHCDYARGLADGILAPFMIKLVSVDFSSDEREEYDSLSRQVRKYRAQLINDFDCPAEPYGEFMRAVSKLSEGNNGSSEMTRCARSYMNASTKRRALLAETTAKIEALGLLGPTLKRSTRALVFTETVDGANRAAAMLVKHGVDVRAYTSRMDRDTRKAVLAHFRSGGIHVLAAPRVLDEGIDLPEADIGVILAANRSRRQMIQRMGRIIRPKRDHRPAIFIILYVRDTYEDPALGAHETFFTEMQDNTDDCKYIDIYRNPNELDIFIAR